jgi:hypothetical protein
MTVVAILLQPAQWMCRWMGEKLHPTPAAAAVEVPDGGTVVISGIAFRPDGTRRYPNGDRMLRDGTIVRRDGTRVRPAPPNRDARGTSHTLVTWSPGVVIVPDEEDTLPVGPALIARSRQD